MVELVSYLVLQQGFNYFWPFAFLYKFRINLLISMKTIFWNFDWDCTKSIELGTIGMGIWIHENSMSLH